MPDYKQTALTGTEWQRCHTVTIDNPLDGAPAIFFTEESVASVGSRTLKQNVPGCRKPFSATGSFPLLDTATNLPTGQTMTHNELYVALYSLYMQTAAERDAVA